MFTFLDYVKFLANSRAYKSLIVGPIIVEPIRA